MFDMTQCVFFSDFSQANGAGGGGDAREPMLFEMNVNITRMYIGSGISFQNINT